jgi:2-dehydro-3-deoxy-D-arabinonate dehydratase
MITLYHTHSGPVVTIDDLTYALYDHSIDALINAENGTAAALRALVPGRPTIEAPTAADLLAPIGTQEVWAAGVTYYRSRDARMEESKDSGGQDFYSRVYTAERPELFMKATAWRVIAPGGDVRIRADSRWNVPEPELALVINAAGAIVGYTIGNDMSSRDIEGENPLYLPQAKVYDGSCSIGPCILVTDEGLVAETPIALSILRNGAEAFSGNTDLTQLKRRPAELASWLYKEMSFPAGAILLTGTGIIPDNDFTLQSGDEIRITIGGIGTLVNRVA